MTPTPIRNTSRPARGTMARAMSDKPAACASTGPASGSTGLIASPTANAATATAASATRPMAEPALLIDPDPAAAQSRYAASIAPRMRAVTAREPGRGDATSDAATAASIRPRTTTRPSRALAATTPPSTTATAAKTAASSTSPGRRRSGSAGPSWFGRGGSCRRRRVGRTSGRRGRSQQPELVERPVPHPGTTDHRRLLDRSEHPRVLRI